MHYSRRNPQSRRGDESGYRTLPHLSACLRKERMVQNKLWRRGKPRRACGTPHAVKSFHLPLVGRTSATPPRSILLSNVSGARQEKIAGNGEFFGSYALLCVVIFYAL